VFVQAWDNACGDISCCLESGEEEVTGNFPCLGQAIHAFFNSGIDVAMVVHKLVQLVLLPNVFRDGVSEESDVLRLREGVVKVEVFDVNAGCSGPWGGDSVVDQALDGDNVSYLGGFVPRKVDEVASHGAPDSVFVSFVLYVVCNNPYICGFLVSWHVLFVDEPAGAGALDCVCGVGVTGVALEEPPYFLAHGKGPSGAHGTPGQFFVLRMFLGVRVDGGIGLALLPVSGW
jgi:hypothetical protein